MAEPIRFAILGAGQSSRLACRELITHPLARITTASDPHPGRLAELSRDLGGLRTYPDSRAALADARVDAVFIATPNALHAPLALDALAAGKHVIVEKPFATSAAEAEAVVRAAERAGKLLTVGMNHRFLPDAQRVVSLARSGKLGRIYHAKAAWHRRAGIPKLGTWFGKRELAGGGALYDIGVHLLDLALHVLGRFDPSAVSGQVYSSFGPRGLGEGGWGLSERAESSFDVDDGASAWLRFADGLTVTLDVSWAIHQREADRLSLTVHGTDGGASCYPAEYYRDGAGPDAYLTAAPEQPLEYPHQSRMHNFVGAILGTEELAVTPPQALAVQRILDAIYESSRCGREVVLSQP